jgi:uncharacterized protein
MGSMTEESAGGPQKHYFAALAQGQFVLQRCGDCERHVFYPRVACPYCGSAALRWVKPAGTGTVYSLTTVRRAQDEGGDYNISLVDLDEGVRMMSRVEGVEPDAVRIGMRVRARIAGAMVVFDRLDPAK